MIEPGSRPAAAAGLRIDAVEVLPTDLRFVLLRVAGAWEGTAPDGLRAPVLLLHAPAGEHRVDPLPATSGAAERAASETRPFRASFSVPDALAPLLDEPVELDLGPFTVRLPAPTPQGEAADAEPPAGTVVDRAVLAERRARRAERAEEANLERASEAELTAARLEGELGKLELRLAAANEERTELARRLAAAARERDALELRVAAAQQEARSEDERRGSLEDRERELQERAEAVAAAERQVAGARGDLAGALARAKAVRAELDVLRTEIADELGPESSGAGPEDAAERAALAEQVERLTAELAGQRAEFAAALGAIAAAVAELPAALDEAEAELQAKLAGPRGPARRANRRASAPRPWLRRALPALARADAAAAGRLALQLLPGQGLAAAAPLDYDVEVAGLGEHWVTIRPGSGELVERAGSGKPRAAFRVEATLAGLVELVIRGGVGRPVGVRVRRTLRRRRAERRLPKVPLALAPLARAGILPDPGLLYRALAEIVDPEWTRGQRFTVALRISGPRGGTWHVAAFDGAPLAVRPAAPDAPADAVVQTTQAGLQHLLDGVPPRAGEKPAMRGDANAIARLGEWANRARNERN